MMNTMTISLLLVLWVMESTVHAAILLAVVMMTKVVVTVLVLLLVRMKALGREQTIIIISFITVTSKPNTMQLTVPRRQS